MTSLHYAHAVLTPDRPVVYKLDCPNCYTPLIRQIGADQLASLVAWHIKIRCHHCEWAWLIDFRPEHISDPINHRSEVPYRTFGDICRSSAYHPISPFRATLWAE